MVMAKVSIVLLNLISLFRSDQDVTLEFTRVNLLTADPSVIPADVAFAALSSSEKKFSLDMDHLKCHIHLIEGIWKDVLDLEAGSYGALDWSCQLTLDSFKGLAEDLIEIGVSSAGAWPEKGIWKDCSEWPPDYVTYMYDQRSKVRLKVASLEFWVLILKPNRKKLLSLIPSPMNVFKKAMVIIQLCPCCPYRRI
ncbi:hypothetical protein C5167_033183 [Papaver somniferum]|uniref:Uncharacterized protein n=1 Tax=Papaver somniferum TaxID=3469 RepID=A0A4Y7KCH3_PAPSO|nr:hypothetical protein C5167_033183 [Papaver somniferum]